MILEGTAMSNHIMYENLDMDEPMNRSNAGSAREYEVVAVWARRNCDERITVVAPGPFTHTQAVTVVSKFNPHKSVRIQLREIEAIR
jgi:hypothetical protein